MKSFPHSQWLSEWEADMGSIWKQVVSLPGEKSRGRWVIFLFFPFVALIKREVKATLNRMLKVPALPLPHEDARELRKDCSPGCLHRAPFPSQIINEIKVHASWLAFFPLFPFYFSPLCLKSTPLS